MLDLGLPGYSRTTSRANSRATSRATSRSSSPISTRSVASDDSEFSVQSYNSQFSINFDTLRTRTRPSSLTMNYQTHRGAKKNETTSQRKANNPNKVVMNSINTRALRANRERELMNRRRQYAQLLGNRPLMATKIVPPEVSEPIKFTNNPKNKAYTMERMPVTDGSKRSYTDRFSPELPKEYTHTQDRSLDDQATSTETKEEDAVAPDVMYHPDEITNKVEEPVKEFVPSWLRNK